MIFLRLTISLPNHCLFRQVTDPKDLKKLRSLPTFLSKHTPQQRNAKVSLRTSC